MTDYIYRVLLLYPESRRDGVEAWYQSEWPNAGELLTPCGVKNGESWYVSSFVAKRSDVDRWLTIFAQSVGQEAPEGLLDLPREAQRYAMQQMALAAQQAIGIVFRAAFNDIGESVDHHALMAEIGVEPLVIDEVGL
jgi:hypothetical protein